MKTEHIEELQCSVVFKKMNGQYFPYTGCYIGTVLIAKYFYNGMRSKGDPEYKVTSTFPSIKGDLGDFRTEEDCRGMCLAVARTIFKLLQSKFKEETDEQSKDN